MSPWNARTLLRKSWLPALLIIVALAARLIPGPRTIDDAFITFRYARNLLAGNGFVYNHGERVLGTTTPLYTLLMAGLAAFTGGTQAPFPTLALLVNALADAGTCLLLWQLGKRLNAERVGIAAALIWAVAPYSVTFAIGGLETSLYVFLLTAAVWTTITRRHTLSALCAVLALLTRPDALILILPLAAVRLLGLVLKNTADRPALNKTFSQRIMGFLRNFGMDDPVPLTWQEIAAFVLPVVAWFGFAWVYFGSPIPHSVTAKLITYHLAPASALIRLRQHYATPFMEDNLLGAAAAVGIGLVLYPFLFIVGARRAWKSDRNLLIWIAYPWLYFITFALPNPLLFRWYLTPPLPAYFFFILLGLEQVLASIFTRNKTTAPRPAAWRAWAITALLVILPLIPTLSEWQLHPDHGPDRPAPEMAFIKLELLYRQAADYLAPQLTSNTMLAAGDVGVLGFYTPARILDTVGLNSPVSLNYYPLDDRYYVINYAIPADLILDQKPDFVVILEVYGRLTLLKDPRFLAQYDLLRTLPTDIYGSNGLLIFKRK
jgi:hypothetical protein